MFRALTSRLLAWLDPKRARPVFIDADARGVVVCSAPRDARAARPTIRWQEVERIRVLRRDVYAGDLVCMRVETVDGRVMELDESASGWEALLNGLPQWLDGVTPRERWFVELMAMPVGATALPIYTRLGKSHSRITRP